MKTWSLCIPLIFCLAACGSGISSDKPSSAPHVRTEQPVGGQDHPASTGKELVGNNDAWAKSYEGTIDGKIQVTLDLHGKRDVVRGSIIYKRTGKPIMVLGTTREDGYMLLEEFQPNGLITGTLSGYEGEGKYRGRWFDNDHDFEFNLAIISSSASDTAWPYAAKDFFAGVYDFHYKEDYNGHPTDPAGEIIIRQADETVSFTIKCLNPPFGSVYEIEGTDAKVIDNEIHYTLREGDCQFVIRFFDGFAILSYIDKRSDCGCGINSGTEGIYLKWSSSPNDGRW